MSKIKRAVSMYSLQDQYARKKMNLEEIFQYLNQLGAGLEFISDQMMKGTPEPSEETLREWDRLVEKYKPVLVCNDVFINTCLYKNRDLTDKEALDLLIKEIKLAHRLGFKMIRLVSNTRASIIEPALPVAMEYDVVMTLEIHAGMSFDDPLTQAYIEVMKKLNSPYVGLTVDTGIFCRRHPRVSSAFFKELGVKQEIIDYVDNIFASGTDPKHYFKEANEQGKPFPDDLKALIETKDEFEYALFCTGYEMSDFHILDEFLPYVKHIHGKIYEMTEEGVEYSIPFDELIAYLNEVGYEGYIATEYEGNRFALANEPIRDKENVTAHQEMLKRYIGE
ncbi:sugar phosphate isomerase/epimerase family protein [Konateibacter massiliensis]|uniref:sugar phosphate isomerase/epimerase family protein n=1 Tax=Konateibacter massiliensis TaxID=2002841 RepID=UPI000C1465A2|nr:TIM barrel protein [Konateibacter massiliensis]